VRRWRSTLRSPNVIGMDAVKTELQTLAFTQLEPEAYATIQARLNFLRGQGADVIDEVRRDLILGCKEAGVEVPN